MVVVGPHVPPAPSDSSGGKAQTKTAACTWGRTCQMIIDDTGFNAWNLHGDLRVQC